MGGVRPRVISSAKPQNAAAASLRQSAAVGESYLNDLLTGGLLDVAGVRVPDADFDLRPDRRWGRSTRRAFIFLFVVLVLGIGGGGRWYWWTEKQKAEAVDAAAARSQAVDRRRRSTPANTGKCIGLETAYKKLVDALEKDKNNVVTLAYIVGDGRPRGAALRLGSRGRVDDAVKGVGKDIATPADKGARELLIGQAAVGLARLHTLPAARRSPRSTTSTSASTSISPRTRATSGRAGSRHARYSPPVIARAVERWSRWPRMATMG